MDVITDYEAYPEWADVKSARVLQRGPGGVGTEVAFEVDVPVLGREIGRASCRERVSSVV